LPAQGFSLASTPRVIAADTMGLADLAGAVDFTLAFALVHELPA